MRLNEPVPFSGSAEEREANFLSHAWARESEDDWSCGRCDAKPYHAAANYPCGVDPPRRITEYGT